MINPQPEKRTTGLRLMRRTATDPASSAKRNKGTGGKEPRQVRNAVEIGSERQTGFGLSENPDKTCIRPNPTLSGGRWQKISTDGMLRHQPFMRPDLVDQSQVPQTSSAHPWFS